MPTEVRSEGIGRYPPSVESAVYFCVLEALNNVAKYAGATRAEVRLAQADGELTFEVSDNGDGFDPAQTGYGTGLQGMADRLDAIGGTLKVHSAAWEGRAGHGASSRLVVPNGPVALLSWKRLRHLATSSG